MLLRFDALLSGDLTKEPSEAICSVSDGRLVVPRVGEDVDESDDEFEARDNVRSPERRGALGGVGRPKAFSDPGDTGRNVRVAGRGLAAGLGETAGAGDCASSSSSSSSRRVWSWSLEEELALRSLKESLLPEIPRPGGKDGFEAWGIRSDYSKCWWRRHVRNSNDPPSGLMISGISTLDSVLPSSARSACRRIASLSPPWQSSCWLTSTPIKSADSRRVETEERRR